LWILSRIINSLIIDGRRDLEELKDEERVPLITNEPNLNSPMSNITDPVIDETPSRKFAYCSTKKYLTLAVDFTIGALSSLVFTFVPL
jgi:hypothetical protein